MFTSTSYKPFVELAQLTSSTFEKTTQAYLQLLNTVSKTTFDAFTTSVKLFDETVQSSTKGKQ